MKKKLKKTCKCKEEAGLFSKDEVDFLEKKWNKLLEIHSELQTYVGATTALLTSFVFVRNIFLLIFALAVGIFALTSAINFILEKNLFLKLKEKWKFNLEFTK